LGISRGTFSGGLASATSTWLSSSAPRLGGKANLVFRWEVFNVFKWPNFANPAGDVSSPSTFGEITAMSVNPRMQFGMKVEF
jgi:hypothetical protein